MSSAELPAELKEREMATLEAKHRPVSGRSHNGVGVDYCRQCIVPWPCDVGVMHSALNAALAAGEALATRVRELEAGLAVIADDENWVPDDGDGHPRWCYWGADGSGPDAQGFARAALGGGENGTN